MSKVILLRCEEYELNILKEKIRLIFNYLGGINNLINRDAKVFIKLNCVGPFEADKAITTNPIFTKAIIQIVKERTSNIIIGDNPATKDITFTLKKNGLFDIITEENLQIINGKNTTTIYNSTPHIYNKFEVSKEMVDCDVLINLPKLKTHSLAYVTCAEKNLFGFIYGLNKAGWHVKASNPLEFGKAINDLYGAIKESFKDKKIINICDGIVGLEGEGPSTGGFPRKANAIIASLDAVSLDRVAVEVMGLDNKKMFITNIASSNNYGNGDLSTIEIIGNKLTDFKDISFIPPRDSLGNFGLKILRIKPIRNILLEHPKIDTNICIKCGECAKICPPKAMTIKTGNYPHLSTKNCIRCWCCAEVCPKNAIKKTKRPLIGRIVF